MSALPWPASDMSLMGASDSMFRLELLQGVQILYIIFVLTFAMNKVVWTSLRYTDQKRCLNPIVFCPKFSKNADYRDLTLKMQKT